MKKILFLVVLSAAMLIGFGYLLNPVGVSSSSYPQSGDSEMARWVLSAAQKDQVILIRDPVQGVDSVRSQIWQHQVVSVEVFLSGQLRVAILPLDDIIDKNVTLPRDVIYTFLPLGEHSVDEWEVLEPLDDLVSYHHLFSDQPFPCDIPPGVSPRDTRDLLNQVGIKLMDSYPPSVIWPFQTTLSWSHWFWFTGS